MPIRYPEKDIPTSINAQDQLLRQCPLCDPAKDGHRPPGTARHLHCLCTNAELSYDAIEDTLRNYKRIRQNAPKPIAATHDISKAIGKTLAAEDAKPRPKNDKEVAAGDWLGDWGWPSLRSHVLIFPLQVRPPSVSPFNFLAALFIRNEPFIKFITRRVRKQVIISFFRWAEETRAGVRYWKPITARAGRPPLTRKEQSTLVMRNLPHGCTVRDIYETWKFYAARNRGPIMHINIEQPLRMAQVVFLHPVPVEAIMRDHRWCGKYTMYDDTPREVTIDIDTI